MNTDRLYFVICDRDERAIGKPTINPIEAAADAIAHSDNTSHQSLVVGVEITYVADPSALADQT